MPRAPLAPLSVNQPARQKKSETPYQRYKFIQRYDSIHGYRLSLEHLQLDGRITWVKLSEGDRQLRDQYIELTAIQRRFYFKLVGMLREWVTRDIGIENFDQVSQPFIWNWETWHRAILKICKKTNNRFTLKNEDCWMSTFATGGVNNPRPKVHIRPGHIEQFQDLSTKDSRVSLRIKYTYDSSNPFQKCGVARVLAVLLHGVPNDSHVQTSHLCYNSPQLCVNPHHVCWESDVKNKSRGHCVNAAAFQCPHQPKCIFTDVQGHLLPHRNLPTYSICDCVEDCYTVQATVEEDDPEGGNEEPPEGEEDEVL